MLLTTGANLSFHHVSGSVRSFDFCVIMIKRLIISEGYIKPNHHISARVLRILAGGLGRFSI